jgi:hypothetical protein
VLHGKALWCPCRYRMAGKLTKGVIWDIPAGWWRHMQNSFVPNGPGSAAKHTSILWYAPAAAPIHVAGGYMMVRTVCLAPLLCCCLVWVHGNCRF